VWLWNNIPSLDPEYKGVRISFMLQEIEFLVGSHLPARASFSEIRDASGTAATAFDTGGFFGARVDWIALNQALGDEEQTIEWFNWAKGDSNATQVIEHVAALLVEPLRKRQRWADVGRLFLDPVAKLSETHQSLGLASLFGPELLGTERMATVRNVAADQFRSAAGVLFASLRAAGRIKESKAIHREALRLDPTDAMRRALDQAPVPYN
jgi:hypothetical protein